MAAAQANKLLEPGMSNMAYTAWEPDYNTGDHSDWRLVLQGPGVAGKAHPDFFRRDVSMGSYLLPNQKIRGSPWLMLGSLGTGTYLGHEDDETDEAVACGVIAGIGHGWNVIDTASNYRSGR